ncbi:MAG: chemotaxis-specific protein-glutamate methyltransferase CheB [Labilithrix sp.]|nr:chemotaxis-specific protein-glutamate methyltransferase CheB [Labilithrix sp.]MCW5811902.1 chemotaxis-specific protein-glutamate methyltransferase CheB [Labilithrix sp.]
MTAPIRLMVVDDSAYNRRTIQEVFQNHPEVEIVGKAADGEEALRMATMLRPDVITLDLEMPRMDGFTFLRILMAKQATPVIVVSSYAQKENVFKALELGALDFVAKPTAQIAPDAADLKQQILEKVLVVRQLRASFAAGAAGASPISRRPPSMGFERAHSPDSIAALRAAAPYVAPKSVVAIASSTGGPSALLEIFGKIPRNTTAGFVVAQHMPDKFTRTFAERLDRKGTVRTSEGQDGDRLGKSTGFVCPGRQCMEVHPNGVELKITIGAPKPEDKYVPSADRLLKSVAAAVGQRAVGVILTGMGDDGVEGARAIRDAGGIVVAEAQETAVVYGMPGAAVRAGLPQKVLPLPQIAEYLASLT